MNRTRKVYTEHGMGMYRQRGCRCEICNAAMAAHRKKYRKMSDNSKLMLDATPLMEWLERNEQLYFLDSNTVARWRERGIGVYTADALCTRMGVHPAEVFGFKFYEGCFDEQ